MRHLIERVLELSDEEQVKPSANNPPIGTGDEAELQALLESLQPRIRVYGVGGAGCNAISRLFEEQLFDSDYVTGYAINTDAQALLMSPLENKILIGRTARGRGAGGDPTKGEAAALESEMSLRTITTDTQLAIIAAGNPVLTYQNYLQEKSIEFKTTVVAGNKIFWDFKGSEEKINNLRYLIQKD